MFQVISFGAVLVDLLSNNISVKVGKNRMMHLNPSLNFLVVHPQTLP
jgi:hypothetical protein